GRGFPRDGGGEDVERRDTQAGPPRGEGQALYGAEPDADSRERPGAQGHRVALDVARGDPGRPQDELDRGQDLAGVPGGPDAGLRQQDEIVGQGHALPLARRIDREDLHRIFTRLYSPPRPFSPNDHPAPDPGHAAVPPDEGGAPGLAALLPHGRLLRALLRGRG